MRRLAVVALAVPALALSACYHAVIETGRPAGTTVVNRAFQPSFIYGLVPPPPLDVSAECPSGVSRVDTQHSFVEGLVAAITVGIFTPMTITATCASGTSGALPADAATVVAANGTLEAKQAAMAEAARRSAETGAAVYVRY